MLWVALACSRSASQWLSLSAPVDGGDLAEGSPVDRLVYTGLLIAGVLLLANRTAQASKLIRANPVILFFFCYCLVTIVWSEFPLVAFKRWTKSVGDFVMVLLVVTDKQPTVAFKRLLTRTSFLLVPLSVLFIKYIPELGRVYGIWLGEAHYTGVTTNKNTLGAICLFFGLGAIWRLIDLVRGQEQERRKLRLIAHGTIFVMVLWLFWLINSMTSMSCFILAVTLVFAASIRAIARRPFLIHLMVAAMITVCVCVLFLGVSPEALQSMGRNPSLTDRTDVWALLLTVADNPILGAGFESFWMGPRLDKIWSVYSWRPLQAHNGYLEIYLNLGWVGIVLLAVVIVTGYGTIATAFRNQLPTARLRLGYFVVGMIFNCTEAAFFRMMAPAWIFFLLSITRFSEPEIAPPVPKVPRKKLFQVETADSGDVAALTGQTV